MGYEREFVRVVSMGRVRATGTGGKGWSPGRGLQAEDLENCLHNTYIGRRKSAPRTLFKRFDFISYF